MVGAGAAVAVTTWENSDVLPPGSVAVALTNCPTPTVTSRFAVKFASPLASVDTSMASINVLPSPNPLGSAMSLAKNSMRKVLFGVLLSEPVMVVVPLKVVADVSTG